MNPKYLALAPALWPSSGKAELSFDLQNQRYDTSYQLYQEESDRITVESWYLRGDIDITESTSFRFQYLRDAISGASPSGAQPGGLQPFLQQLEDVRTGIMGALSQQFGDHRVELEISRSKESDYLSYGLALSDKWELNQKNTTLAYGINYLDDDVRVYGIDPQDKKSYDFFTGVTQIIDKNTIVTANLTIGFNQGYLNDPYKSIQRTDIVQFDDGLGGFIEVPVVNTYAENRPDSRMREVLQLQGTHFFEDAHGALDATLRLAHDDYGVFSQTLQVEWRQACGEKWEITPFARYYRQNAANFFHNTLDGVPITNPPDYPTGSGPNYSADYRLSSLDALSLGLRVRYQLSENVAATAAYERYQMNGIGSDQAPSEAYMAANIWTFGFTAEF
jgi:hypothetical protein